MRIIVMHRTVNYIQKKGRVDVFKHLDSIAERVSSKAGYNVIELK